MWRNYKDWSAHQQAKSKQPASVPAYRRVDPIPEDSSQVDTTRIPTLDEILKSGARRASRPPSEVGSIASYTSVRSLEQKVEVLEETIASQAQSQRALAHQLEDAVKTQEEIKQTLAENTKAVQALVAALTGKQK